jgi:uncharacterized protein (DUF3084 family)
MQLELILPLAGTALAAVTAGVAKVWQLFQQGRADCLERCAGLQAEKTDLQAQVKALQLEVRDLLIHSLALRQQNAKLSARDSDRP